MQTSTVKSRRENLQTGSVRDFFDNHAVEYQGKYDRANKFYEYFFYERLEKATEDFDFKGKKILDIGAGTCPLFDYLAQQNKNNFKAYHATDISRGMLSQGNVPVQDCFVGDFWELELSETYTFIFMLGVSTYLSPDVLKKYLDKMSETLNHDGVLVITFTNKHGLDTLIRRVVRPIRRLLVAQNRVMSQDFQTWFYSKKEIEQLMSDQWSVKKISGLNHTVFPLSRIFSRASIFLAKNVFQSFKGRISRILSSDLLIVCEKSDS